MEQSQRLMEALLKIKTEIEDKLDYEFRSSVEESYGIPTVANTSIVLGLRKKTKIDKRVVTTL